MKKIGFIGIGVMGCAMASNLMKKGYELTVYTRTKQKAEVLLEKGAKWCDTAADCAKGQDAVITMVGFPNDVEEVYFGESGIFSAAEEGTYLIDMTTTSPKLSVKIYNAAKERKMHALDAPVSGGDTGAKMVLCPLWLVAIGKPLMHATTFLPLWVQTSFMKVPLDVVSIQKWRTRLHWAVLFLVYAKRWLMPKRLA